MFWMELLTEAEIVPERKISVLYDDIDQIVAMTVASIKTLRMPFLPSWTLTTEKKYYES